MNYILKLIKYKFFTKINDDYITFISFNGKYADSPKALTKHIHDLDNSKKIIWLVNDIDNNEIPDYVVKIKYGTKEAWDYYCKSKIIIDNVYGMHENYLKGDSIFYKIKYFIISFLKNKKGQLFYTTWHGTPLKKIGLDSIRSSSTNFSCPNTTMILDNQHTADVMKNITLNKIKILLMGSPKNDILFDNKIKIDKLKDDLRLPKNNKIILYAPSFRSNSDETNNIERSGINQINEMDIEQLIDTLNKKFSGNWSLVCRFHYKVEEKIDWNNINKKYGNKVINGNLHQDIMEYIKCSDILITDMSSCLFEFALIDKPVFLYFPDLKHYKNEERGLYFDIETLPFPCSSNFNSLIEKITNFDEKKYQTNVKKFINKLGYIEKKTVSKEIAKYILEDSKEEHNK